LAAALPVGKQRRQRLGGTLHASDSLAGSLEYDPGG
jgi:hypothetical protein